MSGNSEQYILINYLHDRSSEEECLKYEWVRLASYRDFTKEVLISTLKLAKDGFYYTGQSDEVICFFCKCKFFRWENGEYQVERHRGTCCPLFTGIDCSNIPIPRASSNQISVDLERPMQHGVQEYGDNHREDNVSLVAFQTNLPRYPQFANYDARMASFGSCGGEVRSYYYLLANEGFFNNGSVLSARCHFCGFDLRKDPETDPLERHAALFGDCQFLVQHRGMDFIKQQQQQRQSMNQRSNGSQNFQTAAGVRVPCPCQDDEEQRQQIDDSSDKSDRNQHQSEGPTYNGYEAGARPKVLAPSASAHQVLAPIQESINDRNDNLKMKIICKICSEREVQIVFVPCGHLNTCEECANKCNHCVVCLEEIKGRVKAFLS